MRVQPVDEQQVEGGRFAVEVDYRLLGSNSRHGSITAVSGEGRLFEGFAGRSPKPRTPMSASCGKMLPAPSRQVIADGGHRLR